MTVTSRLLIATACAAFAAASSYAADRPAELDRDTGHEVECRAIVLIGGPLQGYVVCKTPREWAQIDRAARSVVV